MSTVNVYVCGDCKHRTEMLEVNEKELTAVCGVCGNTNYWSEFTKYETMTLSSSGIMLEDSVCTDCHKVGKAMRYNDVVVCSNCGVEGWDHVRKASVETLYEDAMEWEADEARMNEAYG